MTSSSSLSDGMREVSINFDAADGINGRVRPGDKVDVVAAFAARQSSQNQVDQSVRKAHLPYNVAGIVVSQALVVSVGEKTPVGIEVGAATDGNADPQEVVPVTFALSVKDSTALAYAEAFSVKMRIMRSGNNESGKKVTPDARKLQRHAAAPAAAGDRDRAAHRQGRRQEDRRARVDRRQGLRHAARHRGRREQPMSLPGADRGAVAGAWRPTWPRPSPRRVRRPSAR
ncbi:hypothetical protein GCM10025868_34100 [Angustibacter aerolatus]|uniref:Flp pilus assembly protein RcpC/CpaB domain-containing protein n=1 Tax=Angustibacter aerolatus TaxID=1162965 RepID=A0ABQ6JLN3_9ACTN|nr:hypothetical protein GCM10025868_34100 [Angustibacter aerolatus]